MNVLAIGNSFSANAIRFLPALVQADGSVSLTLGHANIGGCPLEKHVRLARLHESNPAIPEGTPYWHQGKPAALQDLLRAEAWDVVTLQQFSGWSYHYETYTPHAANLRDLIFEHAPNTEIRIHQTWAYRDDDPLFKDGFTRAKMHLGLVRAYTKAARLIGVPRWIPVGNAFHHVLAHRDWRFRKDPSFDSTTARFPELPHYPHSLHAGWQWRRNDAGESVLGYDGHHANGNGEFLGACVWFECLFGRDVRRNAFVPAGMALEDADFLKAAAHAVVKEGTRI